MLFTVFEYFLYVINKPLKRYRIHRDRRNLQPEYENVIIQTKLEKLRSSAYALYSGVSRLIRSSFTKLINAGLLAQSQRSDYARIDVVIIILILPRFALFI